MKSDKFIATYRRLRSQPVWRLLAADNGPIILGLLQTHFCEGQRRISASLLHEYISRDIESLRSQGEDFPQTAQSYVSDWLSSGYLERRFPVNASEEEYELSLGGSDAIRIVSSLIAPRTSATESRLSTVIHQLVQLAEETDTNPQTRIASLLAERHRIDAEIKEIEQGRMKSIPDARAHERIREIVSLADDLAGDFCRVRDQFEHLNRDLRRKIMDNDGSRGDVLSALFAGVDLITESDAGQTFSAFWRLLTDPEQSATFEEALDKVMSRKFITLLDIKDRRFLLRLTRILLEQGGMVHEVMQQFARSLKHFVQSREYLEQRRLNDLLREAQTIALSLKDRIKATDAIEYILPLTTCHINSIARWVLFDPSLQVTPGSMIDGEAAPIDLECVCELVAQSEIDFRTLKANIRQLLLEYSQVSIAEILDKFPASQGLGSIVGYIALGSRLGLRGNTYEKILWYGHDKQQRSAKIPTIYFLRQRADELV